MFLAPARGCVPPVWSRHKYDEAEHRRRLAQLQRLRGKLYGEDGALEPWQLTADGRHRTEADETSWHLLRLQGDEVLGCARFHVHAYESPFCALDLACSAQVQCPDWGTALRRGITAERQRAQAEGISFAEAGGWALAPELRGTTEALQIVLASFAFGQLLGGCLGVSTATTRHHSASILRRLGGTSLLSEGRALPRYYDSAYRCEMEFVRFDSRTPNPRYQPLVTQMQEQLRQVPVLCAHRITSTFSESLAALAEALGTKSDHTADNALVSTLSDVFVTTSRRPPDPHAGPEEPKVLTD